MDSYFFGAMAANLCSCQKKGGSVECASRKKRPDSIGTAHAEALNLTWTHAMLPFGRNCQAQFEKFFHSHTTAAVDQSRKKPRLRTQVCFEQDARCGCLNQGDSRLFGRKPRQRETSSVNLACGLRHVARVFAPRGG